jgi:acyl carrier protein
VITGEVMTDTLKASLETVRPEVRQFVVSNFLFGEGSSSFGDDDSFLETGIIDSTGVLELVAFLEEQFAVKISDQELLPENLDSVNLVAKFVCRKLYE